MSSATLLVIILVTILPDSYVGISWPRPIFFPDGATCEENRPHLEATIRELAMKSEDQSPDHVTSFCFPFDIKEEEET